MSAKLIDALNERAALLDDRARDMRDTSPAATLGQVGHTTGPGPEVLELLATEFRALAHLGQGLETGT